MSILPPRSTRGKRMRAVMEEQEDEADTQFWNQEFFAEEAEDVDYEEEKVSEDVPDSDFDEPEDEEDDDEGRDEEDDKPKRKALKAPEPKAPPKPKAPKPAQPKQEPGSDEAPKAKSRESSVPKEPVVYAVPSLRRSTMVRVAEAERQRQEQVRPNRPTARKGSEWRPLTQAELLAEAARNEIDNIQSLKLLLAMEEETKRKATVVKQQYRGALVKVLSRRRLATATPAAAPATTTAAAGKDAAAQPTAQPTAQSTAQPATQMPAETATPTSTEAADAKPPTPPPGPSTTTAAAAVSVSASVTATPMDVDGQGAPGDAQAQLAEGKQQQPQPTEQSASVPAATQAAVSVTKPQPDESVGGKQESVIAQPADKEGMVDGQKQAQAAGDTDGGGDTKQPSRTTATGTNEEAAGDRKTPAATPAGELAQPQVAQKQHYESTLVYELHNMHYPPMWLRRKKAPPPPAPLLCMVIGTPARYRDPVTGVGYSTVAALRRLRGLPPAPAKTTPPAPIMPQGKGFNTSTCLVPGAGKRQVLGPHAFKALAVLPPEPAPPQPPSLQLTTVPHMSLAPPMMAMVMDLANS